MPAPDHPIIGIDLGTTNSLVAHGDDSGTPRIIPDASGRNLLPSVVRYSAGGKVEAVGHDARARAAAHAGWTISSVKRLMGRSRRDAEADLPHLPFEVIEGPNATARVKLPDGTIISPQEVSAAILRTLRDQAEESLSHSSLSTQHSLPSTPSVTRAVVTVPAYFDDAQRQATRDAGRLAGLDIVRIVNEPTAAALAYGIGLKARREETIAVYDLGGGTFDISILKVIPREMPSPASRTPQAATPLSDTDFFQVLATKGDTHLGGDDVDQLIASHIIASRTAPASDPFLLSLPQGEGGERGSFLSLRARQSLRAAAEQIKVALSDSDHTTKQIELEGQPPFDVTMTRADLETLITSWVDRTIELCKRALRDAKRTPADIDRVVMVGGSTRIPLVRRRVGEFFATEPYTALNPDEVVALGAAVQASILSGTTNDLLLLDVIPLSLGIETVGGAFAKIIVKNTTIPARATEMFSTSVDGQTSIKLTILQGEREMAADCRNLGVFHLKGIPPMPAGIPQIEVEFLVDASGILNVSAHERRSGKRAALQVVPNHGLTTDEIERIEAASLAHAREDMTRHRIVDLIANSKLDLKWIGDRLATIGSSLPPEYRAELETKVELLRALVDRAETDWRAVNPNEFHAAKEALDQASVRMHEISIAESLRTQ